MKELLEDYRIANNNLYCDNKMLEKEIESLNRELEHYKKEEELYKYYQKKCLD